MAEDEKQVILRRLKEKKNATMLEWGSGGSTLAFPKHVARYHSIEHDEPWFNKVSKQAPDNVQMFLIPAEGEVVRDQQSAKCWDDLFSCEYMKAYGTYVYAPKDMLERFDFVLIDGRARPQCARSIFGSLHEDSIVFMHDWNPARPHYKVVLEHYDIVEEIEGDSARRQGIVALTPKRESWKKYVR